MTGRPAGAARFVLLAIVLGMVGACASPSPGATPSEHPAIVPSDVTATDGRADALALVERAAGQNGCVNFIDVTLQALRPDQQTKLIAAARAVAPGGGWLQPGGPWSRAQFWAGKRAGAIQAWGATETGSEWAVAVPPTGPIAFQVVETVLTDDLTLWSLGDREELCAPDPSGALRSRHLS